MRRLVVASTNPGKAREIRTLLQSLQAWAVEPLQSNIPEIEEIGSTFLENAIQKAEYYSRTIDGWIVADDSGLVVDALDGRPGIHSARYAPTDQERNRKLLHELENVRDAERTARFVCALALAWAGRTVWSIEERLEGRIALAPAGEHGFGYDPVFWIPEFEQTMGQLKPEVKNRISHRGLALARLREHLETYE